VYLLIYYLYDVQLSHLYSMCDLKSHLSS